MARRRALSPTLNGLARQGLILFFVLFISAAPAALFSAQGLLTDASSYPNPFDSRDADARISYRLSRDEAVSLRIYNVYGALIAARDFPSGTVGARAGANAATWNGSDAAGEKVSKGVYLAVLQAGGDRRVIKIGVVH